MLSAFGYAAGGVGEVVGFVGVGVAVVGGGVVGVSVGVGVGVVVGVGVGVGVTPNFSTAAKTSLVVHSSYATIFACVMLPVGLTQALTAAGELLAAMVNDAITKASPRTNAAIRFLNV